MILSRCRLESHQVEGICWDRPQDDLCPGSDDNNLPWLGHHSDPGSDLVEISASSSLSRTRPNTNIFILTHSVTDKFITSVLLHSHKYIFWDLGKPILMKHYHTSSSSSPPSNSCLRREIFGPAVGQILRLCWLFRGRGLPEEVVRLWLCQCFFSLLVLCPAQRLFVCGSGFDSASQRICSGSSSARLSDLDWLQDSPKLSLNRDSCPSTESSLAELLRAPEEPRTLARSANVPFLDGV